MKTGFHFTEDSEKYLNEANVQDLKINYTKSLTDNPFPQISFKAKSHTSTLYKLKRESYNIGPYTNISIFEAANRIATDLTMFDGVLALIKKDKKLGNKVMLRFGSKHENGRGDFTFLLKNGEEVEGECFDVAASFFKSKLYKTLKKWEGNDKFRYLVFNSDVLNDEKCSQYFKTKMSEWEGKLTVEIVDVWAGVFD
jgi:hypothetical protein